MNIEILEQYANKLETNHSFITWESYDEGSIWIDGTDSFISIILTEEGVELAHHKAHDDDEPTYCKTVKTFRGVEDYVKERFSL